MFDFIDKVVYINLERRNDRRKHMEKMTSVFGDKVIRFLAIEHNPGNIGCTMSHVAVLKMALDKKWKNVLILEDDVEWNRFGQGYNILQTLAMNSYDVILLGGGSIHFDSKTYKLHSSQTTTAYLVNGHYIPRLLENFEYGLKGLIETNNPWEYAIDMQWKKLQASDNWFIVSPSLVYQIPNYSDIEGKHVDYRDGMNLGSDPVLLPFLKRH
jgi:glycosyl transferase family 25